MLMGFGQQQQHWAVFSQLSLSDRRNEENYISHHPLAAQMPDPGSGLSPWKI
jgi:hypothetical protein